MNINPVRKAILLHKVKLPQGTGVFQLCEGISCGELKGSRIGQLYEKICLEDGVDNGDPFNYDLFFDIDVEKHQDMIGDDSPFNIASRLCNITTICTQSHFGMARIIWSNDSYSSASETFEIFKYTEQDQQTDWHNQHPFPAISVEMLKKCWESENELTLNKYNFYKESQVANALVFFFYAWRSYHIEEACIHLAIVLESLFAPASTQELSHQISFNAAKFCGQTSQEKENIYTNLKRFYKIRSQLVHGEQPENSKVLEVVDFAYPFICKCIHRILSDIQLLKEFDNKSQRNALFKKWLFE